MWGRGRKEEGGIGKGIGMGKNDLGERKIIVTRSVLVLLKACACFCYA